MDAPDASSIKEDRIRKITFLYYSRKDIQRALFEFSKNREIAPSYMMESFGKRPDSFQYPGDIFELVKKGATSFHCSEELWQDPLKISTGMSESKLNELRIGWDVLLDIDCKWFDYSKMAASAIINVLKKHNVKNIGVKFSGSKGWHILIPWKAFPKEIGGGETKNFFPEIPRKIVGYIRNKARDEIEKNLPKDFYEQFKDVNINKGIKCNNCNEIAREYNLVEFYCKNCKIGEERNLNKEENRDFFCPNCSKKFAVKKTIVLYECRKCDINSKNNPTNFSKKIEHDLFDLMGLDIILVSPRHLFRMPYSLHEKTALASVVLKPEEIKNFQPKDANPFKIEIRNFMPDSKEGEASELLREALDWYKTKNPEEAEKTGREFKPVILKEISEKNFPPAIIKILEGIKGDGRKRAVFIIMNFFRSVGMDRKDVEKVLRDWNQKNEIPLKEGYITSQLIASYRGKPIPPPNYDKDYYKGIGIVPTEEELRCKNPVSYMVRKSLRENYEDKKKKSTKDNFKNKV
jgi:hypothetical protein